MLYCIFSNLNLHSLVQYKTHPLNLGNFLEALNSKPDVMPFWRQKLPFSPLNLEEFSLTLAALVICFQTKKTRLRFFLGPPVCHVGLQQGQYMDVSKNGGTPKSSNSNRVFSYKPSILRYPYFRKHPYIHAILIFLGVLFFGELSSDKFISVYLFIHFAVVRFFCF